MTDMDEIAYADSLDDESIFEWDDESIDDEAFDDESFFRPPQRPSRPSRNGGRQRPKLAKPLRLPQRAARAGAASLMSNDRRLEQNDQRLAQNERRLAQGQEQLASKISELDKDQDTQQSKLSKFEKSIDQRIKSLEA